MTTLIAAAAHPNEFDRHRIARALAQRQRYRYVAPSVLGAKNGYKVESPCCSRNIDTGGGVIDIALLEFDTAQKLWRLSRKDHATNEWCLTAMFPRLHEALRMLAEDAERIFWQ